MKTYLNILQAVIIITIISLNGYAIADGIRVGSFWGIVLALVSLTALGYCIHFVNKLKRLDEEECEN
jgi:hypothetical protein